MSLNKRAKEISKILINCFETGGKVLVCGNGGSAAEATHLVGELIGHFELPRKPLPAISLFDLSSMTAIANDDGYEYVFSRPLIALGNKGDVLIVLSTSGESQSCLNAIQAARVKEMKVIEFPNRSQALYMNETTADLQELHLYLIHDSCRIIDKYFHEENYSDV